ncbi:histidine phosphatase family protein [Clostridium sp. MSJ-4]|uniref:Histidine phosphatase family protein n=1 Tax=Clostridium simiarum TaxID=2841506 RepID=A0ABS6F3J3_9CLOT|nr:histidine phosphatase family protein [Clostridium simiarum]MBU5593038.1 histidine phosphatase family protein [Clostridium simiarum]
MLEILVVRHGQSIADLEYRHEGRANFPLTDLGVNQAKAAATWIKNNFQPEIIISSTLQRAYKTAEIIGDATGAKIIKEENIMEWNNGLLAGLLRDEAEKIYPMPDGGRKPHHEFAESESYINFRARAEMFWSKFIEEYYSYDEDKRICMVSHGGMINMLFASFLNLPINNNSILVTGDTGMHLWRIKDNRKIIVFSNSLKHLK